MLFSLDKPIDLDQGDNRKLRNYGGKNNQSNYSHIKDMPSQLNIWLSLIKMFVLKTYHGNKLGHFDKNDTM